MKNFAARGSVILLFLSLGTIPSAPAAEPKKSLVPELSSRGPALLPEASQALQRSLAKAGWKPKEERAPERARLELRPSAFAKPGREAFAALRSRAFGGDDLVKLRSIIHADIDPKLREAAFAALAASPDPRAQLLLVELYASAKDERRRRRILAALDPLRGGEGARALLEKEAKGSSASRRKAVLARLAAFHAASKKPTKAYPSALTLEPGISKAVSELRSAAARRLVFEAEEKDDVLGRCPDADVVRKPEGGSGLSTVLPGLPDLMAGTRAKLGRSPTPEPTPDPEKPHELFLKVGASGTLTRPRPADTEKPAEFRQIVVFPAGYGKDDHRDFMDDASLMISNMGNLPEGVYTRDFRDRLLYVVAWRPGGALGSETANFHAKTYVHPTYQGKKGLTLDNAEVVAAVADLQEERSGLAPIGVVVIFKVDDETTAAYATLPMFLGKPFGVVRIGSNELCMTAKSGETRTGQTRPAHELAHGALNLLDEYILPELAGVDVTSLDPLTPLVQMDGSWSGFWNAWEDLIGNYDLRVSEILADTGAPNISTREHPATVESAEPPYERYRFRWEGGMWFGAGTFHHDGNNLMNTRRISPDSPLKPDGDRFAAAHSRVQQDVVDQVFDVENRARRPNDRLRNAGPLRDWLPQIGSSVRFLLHDADKFNRWHPTKKYEVRVGWYELDLSSCDPLDVARLDRCDPTNDANWKWKTLTREFDPSRRTVDLSRALAADGLGLLRDGLVAVGVSEIKAPDQEEGFNLAAMTVDQLLAETLPTVTFPVPYQDVAIELPTGEFWWKFRTYNGTHWSAFTEYSRVRKL